jgi:pimeloyl-ACP methyl ester carboxylesterase
MKIIKLAVLIFTISVFMVSVLSCSNTPSFGEKELKTYGEESALIQEVRFKSDGFRIVGELRFPSEGEKYPVVILVHGSGSATRDGAVNFEPLIEIFLRRGYAVFSWDKPGSGESTGNFENALTQRADILVDGITALTEHPDIDAMSVGLWGVSQAGWVMPLVLDNMDNITFMIVVGGGGEDSIEQMAYQVGQKVICDGGTEEQAALVEKYWSQWTKATSYTEYQEALEIILAIPGVQEYTGLSILDEENWNPRSQDSDAFINPMDFITHATIPILVFYGELDKNVDPVQGAEAYETTLNKAGNQNYRIEIIPGAGHVLTPAQTGCIGESGNRNYVPQYLEIMEDWLKNLPG